MAEIIPIKNNQEKPVLYYYQQEFDYQGERKTRSGFISLVKLEPSDKGIILPHQEILPELSDEQLSLLKTDKSKVSAVLGLYADFSYNLDKLIQEAAGNNTDTQFTDVDGVTHSLKEISDDTIIKQVQQMMERQRIFIASGHHSYDAAWRYYQENPEAKYITMTLMNLYDPNLVILPVHRLVKDVPNFKVDKFMKQLREDYVVEPYKVDPHGENMQEFLQAMSHKAGFDLDLGIEHLRTFGLYTGNGQGYLVTLQSEMTMDRLMPKEGYSLALQGTDVFVLHYTVLERLLGIGNKIIEESTKQTKEAVKPGTVIYMKKEIDAVKKVDSGEYQLAFFLNPVVFDEFVSVTIGGEVMPPKSTYFYPQPPAELMARL